MDTDERRGERTNAAARRTDTADDGEKLTCGGVSHIAEIMAEGDHEENDREVAHDIKRIDPNELAEATRIQLKKVDKIKI